MTDPVREAFEAKFSKHNLRRIDEQYMDATVHLMFKGWQAAEAAMSQEVERLTELLDGIVASTKSHLDARDLLDELHPRRSIDIKRRVDGVETWFEGDWLGGLRDAIKLYSQPERVAGYSKEYIVKRAKQYRATINAVRAYALPTNPTNEQEG